jgi:hypothetical protein
MFYGYLHCVDLDDDDLLEMQLENSSDAEIDTKCKKCGSDMVMYQSAFPASSKTPEMVCPNKECK